MTDLAAIPATFRSSPKRRIVRLYGCLLLAAAAGTAIGRLHAGDAALVEDRLVLLLRFMAVLKAGAVFAAAALVHWRLSRPLADPAFAGYLVAISLMALAPGLIATLGFVAVGALLFHAGLLAFLVLAARDGEVAGALGARHRSP